MEEEPKTEIKPVLSWIQVEYVKHDKSTRWYAVVIVALAVFAAIIILATQSWFSLAVLALAAVSTFIYASKEPKKVPYDLFDNGFAVNNRVYLYDEFKSFSPIIENGIKGVIFNPVGRLQLPMNLYFTSDVADQAYDLLERSTVFEQYQPDLLQRIIDLIRF